MTEYQTICAQRTEITLAKLIEATQAPVSSIEIAAATGLSKGHVRETIIRFPEYFKDCGFAPSTGANPKKLYQARQDVARHPVLIATAGVIHMMQDSPKYHDSMKLLRDNRKPLRVFVAGGTLG